MPIYTFKCPSCNRVEDITQSMKAATPVCQRCVSASCGVHIVEMKRQFTSSGGFKLKGGGWYKDGYTKPEKPKWRL